jgi:hypothetical protein
VAETAATVTTNTESGFENDEDGRERYGKWQMIGMDNEGGVSGDDCTGAEASAECSDMKGKLYLSLDSFYYDSLQGFYTTL